MGIEMNDKEVGSQAAYGHAAFLVVLGLTKYIGQNGYLPDIELRNIVDLSVRRPSSQWRDEL